MLFIFLIVLFTVGYTFLLNLIPTPGAWFIAIWILVALLLAILTVVGFIILFLTFAPRKNPTGKIRHFLLRSGVKLFIAIYHVRLEVEGKENIPDQNETIVVYANHKSNMDPLLIYKALHRRLTAVGKKSLFQNWLMKNVQLTFGAVALDRDNNREGAKQIVQAIRDIKNGVSMIIFPEGGIKSRDEEEMVSLRAGAYKLVTKTEATILPISIIGSSEISKRKRNKRKDVKIIVHKPIRYNEFKEMNTTEIGIMVEEIINNGVKNGEI